MVEPVLVLNVAKQGTRVRSMMEEAEAQDTSSVPTLNQCARVDVPPMSLLEGSSDSLSSVVATIFQRMEV